MPPSLPEPPWSPIYVLGRNELARCLLAALDVAGVIDDWAEADAFAGRPVVPVEAVPARSLVVNCATALRPVQAADRLRAAGLCQVSSFGDLLAAFPASIPVPAFAEAMRNELAERRGSWTALAAALADARSQALLADLVAAWTKADYRFLARHRESRSAQYLDPAVALPEGAVIVDGGSYTGDTAAAFLRTWPGLGALHLVEADATNRAALPAYIADDPRVTVHAAALWDSPGELGLNSPGSDSSASRVGAAGALRVPAIPLDSALAGPIDFVKLDIEGAEPQALAGAAELIRTHRPKLAICVYHAAHHPVAIWREVTALRADYRVYLRHYSEGFCETVMYFIPAEAD